MVLLGETLFVLALPKCAEKFSLVLWFKLFLVSLFPIFRSGVGIGVSVLGLGVWVWFFSVSLFSSTPQYHMYGSGDPPSGAAGGYDPALRAAPGLGNNQVSGHCTCVGPSWLFGEPFNLQ